MLTVVRMLLTTTLLAKGSSLLIAWLREKIQINLVPIRWLMADFGGFVFLFVCFFTMDLHGTPYSKRRWKLQCADIWSDLINRFFFFIYASNYLMFGGNWYEYFYICNLALACLKHVNQSRSWSILLNRVKSQYFIF